MQAEELLRGGDLAAALGDLQGRIRKAPADSRLRIFLFQLLCVLGDWPRALNQLKICGELNSVAQPMVQTYRETIACELLREKVFAGEKAPLVLGEPVEWIALLIEALKPLAAGQPGRAAELRARAFDAADAAPGTIDDVPFAWIADSDMRLGPMLELLVNGKYYWAPFSAMASLSFDAPTDLRDLVWTPVEIRWRNGGDSMGFVPTRYPGTAACGRDDLRLSRRTEWRDLGAETFAGLGQRQLSTDAGDHALMDIRRIAFTVPAAEPADE
jgi:type VI secretion system protein ImpE